jgi:hypothetical protein
MTRNTAAAVLTRIKTEVFGLEEGSSLGAAFERAGIVNVHDLLALSTAKKSTKAQLTRDKLVTELTTSKLDSSWKGTHKGFVLMWKEKMRLLEDISPQSNYYSTEVKLSMLQNAVLIVPKLSSILDISNNLVAIGNNLYQAYSELLISGCNQLDKDLQVTHSKSKRTVYYTSFKEEDYFDRGYLAHHLNDAPMSTILLVAIKRPIAMSSLMLSTQIRMHQHRRQCQEKFSFGYHTRTVVPPSTSGQLLHQPRLTTAPLSLTVSATSKLIPTVFSTDSAKQPVLTTAKEFLPSLIEVQTVAWLEEMSASSSILSVRQTSVVSTTIPRLAYPLLLRQVS